MKNRPFFEKYLPYLLFIFLGYCIADLAILNFRDRMLPTEAPPAHPKQGLNDQFPSRSAYDSIIARNIFSSDNLIPEPIVDQAKKDQAKQQDAAPVLSSLPLILKGTIVHTNPAKSIANIEVKSKNSTLAYAVGRDIEGLATLMKVERTQIIFRNLNNGRLEYVEMKMDGGKISFGMMKATPSASAGTGKSDVAQVAPNKFEIKRSDLLKYTNDMASVLQQAAMAPRRGANGEIECFKFLSIQPGSIYTQLGFQNGDCIAAVNGAKVDSPAKAMEMYNSLKNSPNIKLQYERDGRNQESDYTVK